MLGSRGVAVFAFAVMTLTAWGCGANNEQNHTHLLWHTGAATLRGHEDITRFAVEISNEHLGDRHDIGYEPVPIGTHGPITLHPLVKGNFDSDFPTLEMRQFYGASPKTDWHNDDNLQHVHALRNRGSGGVASNSETCQSVRLAIEQSLRRAIGHLQSGDRYHYHYWVGHALHILQDSYSPAHTIRVGPESQTLVAFCTYRVHAEGICYHHEVDPRDRVWRPESLRCTFDSKRRDWDCLVPQAQHAAIASADLLTALGKRLDSGEALESSLSPVWLKHLSCDGL